MSKSKQILKAQNRQLLEAIRSLRSTHGELMAMAERSGLTCKCGDKTILEGDCVCRDNTCQECLGNNDWYDSGNPCAGEPCEPCDNC